MIHSNQLLINQDLARKPQILYQGILMKNFLVLLGLVLGLNIYAQDSTVSVRTYVSSCGYFSNFSADIRATLSDETLADDSKVKLLYGLGSSEKKTDWNVLGEVNTKKGSRQKRVAETSITLWQRGQDHHYDSIQFVWQISLSNGDNYYIKGNESLLGFYEAKFASIHESKCITSEANRPPFRKVPVYSVKR
jgi:hypothetical protein